MTIRAMSKSRLEAFSDGVMAIVITIMVINIPLPNVFDSEHLMNFVFGTLVFFVSFFVVGAQWINHHRLFTLCEKVSDKLLWRNLLYLFFLSLLPVFTKWIMENPQEVIPAIAYDIVFLAVFFSYHLLQNVIIKENMNMKQLFDQVQRERVRERRGFFLMGITFIFVVLIILISFLYPTVSIFFFIALPVTSSLFNLWIDREDKFNRRRKKRIRMK